MGSVLLPFAAPGTLGACLCSAPNISGYCQLLIQKAQGVDIQLCSSLQEAGEAPVIFFFFFLKCKFAFNVFAG